MFCKTSMQMNLDFRDVCCLSVYIVIEYGCSYLLAFSACFLSSYLSINEIHIAVKAQKVSIRLH